MRARARVSATAKVRVRVGVRARVRARARARVRARPRVSTRGWRGRGFMAKQVICWKGQDFFRYTLNPLYFYTVCWKYTNLLVNI